MTETADAQRAIVRELYAKRGRDDLTEKRFQSQLTDAATALARAVVEARLDPGERILAESHVVHTHIKLAESVLAEPEQQTVSIFATDRRLLRLRGSEVPGRPVSCDEADGTVLDELALNRVERLLMCVDLRWSEAIAGGVIMVATWVLRGFLQVTGALLILLGLAGVLHALLLPTRSIRIVAAGEARPHPFVLFGVRRKDTRALIAVIRRAIARRESSVGGGSPS